MLKLQSLSFIRQGKSVLSEVTTAISEGALVCLVGANGAGKTTLLRVISGELKATSGSFLIDDKNVCGVAQKEVGGCFALIPQGVQPPPYFTVFDLVVMGRFRPRNWALSWRLDDRDRHIVETCLVQCGVEKLSNRRVEEISGGEQQRAWLAFALAQQKRFLLLDETLDGLDVFAKQSLFKLLKKLTLEGKGVLLTTHDLDLVTKFADKVIVLTGGSISYDGSPSMDLQCFLSQASG